MQSILKQLITDKTVWITSLLSLAVFILGRGRMADIDWQTILALLALLILITLYETTGVLTYFAALLIDKTRTVRGLVLSLLSLAFIESLFFTNDVAILTLMPILFKLAKKITLPTAVVAVLLAIYANLGSALTPFGNPQNIYIAHHYQLAAGDFLTMSLPLGLISLVSMFGVAHFFAKDVFESLEMTRPKLVGAHLWVLSVATVVIFLGLLAIIPVGYAVGAGVVTLILINWRTYTEVDYGIIVTFLNFFIVVGALGRLSVVDQLLHHVSQQAVGVYGAGILASQVMSNVPAAVLLSKFTANAQAVFLGVTVGGLGTPIASLANLLMLRQYSAWHKADLGRVMRVFGIYNIIFLLFFGIIGWLLL